MSRTKISEEVLMNNLNKLDSLAMRTLNRCYLHPKNQRCCSNCLIIYNGIKENFHIKRYHENRKYISYNVHCKKCKNNYFNELRLEYRNNPEQFIKSKLSAYKCRANEINTPFNLTTDFLIKIWKMQKGLCFYTKEIIDFTLITESNKHPHLQQPSLDRLYPNKGYTIGNVVWCSYKINRMKNEFTYDEFIDYCNLIIERKGDF